MKARSLKLGQVHSKVGPFGRDISWRYGSMASTGEVVATVEGPQGTAEIMEVPQIAGDGGQRLEYVVAFGGQNQTFPSLGEAYITAGELSGTET
jgi:hypothetical protein